MSDPSYPAFPVFAFISFVLVLIPLPWHFQAWNSGTCLYMIWTALGCLNLFINSIVWRDDAIDRAPIWCDISTRIIVGVSVAIPAASLCINRRLYKIASCQTATISIAQKKRAVMIDLAIGLGIPAIQMALQFVVQGHRYDIFEDIGCYPTTVNTPPAYPLSFVWPTVIGLVSAVYCILTLRAFMQRRAEFSQFLSSNTSLSVNRYFRLMALATVELLFNVPLSSYGLYLNATGRPIYRWKSWSDTHFDWYIIDTFPAILWRTSTVSVVNFELSRWLLVFCALVFFGFFGFAEEARKNYRRLYWSVAKRFGVVPPSKSPSGSNALSSLKKYVQSSPVKSGGTLPVFVPRPLQLTSTKRDSLSSSTEPSSYQKSEFTASVDQMVIYPDSKTHHSLTPETPSSYTSSETFTLGSSSPTHNHKSDFP
ncbi:pheromone A receptor-domain-containing protein [Flammula alnicola]|nr:pheromone A receptor-domain-containing protein [Flammula alnicola]